MLLHLMWPLPKTVEAAKARAPDQHSATGTVSSLNPAPMAHSIIHSIVQRYIGMAGAQLPTATAAAQPRNAAAKAATTAPVLEHWRVEWDYVPQAPGASKLPVKKGAIITGSRVTGGWLWATASDGSQGWVPKSYLVPAAAGAAAAAVTTGATPKKKTTASPRKNAKKRPLEEDPEEIEVLSAKVPLIDIVSKQRIVMSVRTTKCAHREAFDFLSFCNVNKVPQSLFPLPNLKNFQYFLKPLPLLEADIPPAPTEAETVRSRSSSVGVVRQRFTIQQTPPKGRRPAKPKAIPRTQTFKCPVCNVKFQHNELVPDDYMALVLKHVPEDVQVVEIDDKGVITVMEEKKPYEVAEEVVTLSDGEDDSLGLEMIEKDIYEAANSNGNGQHHAGGRKKKKIRLETGSDEEPLEFTDSEGSSDEILFVEGTLDDPVVID